jgi:hypothetical protein
VPRTLDRLAELHARIDGAFARIHARHRAAMACAAGCHECCQPGLTITAVEAAAIRALLSDLPADRRAALRLRAARPPADRCAALEPDGRCGVYPARPIVCRSHGAPIRLPEPRTRLPVLVACDKNFLAGLPDAPEDRFDQETLSTIVLALDRAHARETDAGGDAAPARTALIDLLA